MNPGDVVIAAAVLVFLFTAQSQWPRLPGPLAAVLLSTAVCAIFSLGQHGVALVGHIPAGLPTPGLPKVDLSDVRELMLPALGVLLVAFSDDVLTGRAFERGSESIDANTELLALGVSNAGAGLLRGFPISSSGSRTAIGLAAGARTQAYSLTALASILGVLLFARPVLASFPEAALGAIVIYAAVRLIDVQAFRKLAAFRRSEFVLALAACTGVLIFDILYGVLAAVGLSVAELLWRVGRPHDAIQGLVPGLAGMHDVDDYPQAETIPGLVVYRYDAPLFFANAQDFRRRALAAAGHGPGQARWFVLNTEANVEVDFTALEAVEAVRAELSRRGTIFALARVKQDLLDDLEAFGLAGKVGVQHIFPTLPTAVAAYRQWASQHPRPCEHEPSARARPGYALASRRAESTFAMASSGIPSGTAPWVSICTCTGCGPCMAHLPSGRVVTGAADRARPPGRHCPVTGNRSRAAIRNGASRIAENCPPSCRVRWTISSIRSGTGCAAVPQSGQLSAATPSRPHRPHT